MNRFSTNHAANDTTTATCLNSLLLSLHHFFTDSTANSVSEFVLFFIGIHMPSVLWCCWFGGRKGIQPVKTEWWGTGKVIISAPRCKWFAYGPADATATISSLAPVKSRMVYFSGAGLPRLSWKKRPLNGCSSSSSNHVIVALITSRQSNLTQGCIAAAHGWFRCIRQMAPMCTPYIESQKRSPSRCPLVAAYWQYLNFVGRPLKPPSITIA